MLAIRDCMRAVPNDVCTVTLGMAYSAGQFLLSSGTPGKRYAFRHAKVLLHQGSAGIGGSAADIAIQADDLRATRDTVLGLIASDTGQRVETVERDSRRDRWFTAAAGARLRLHRRDRRVRRSGSAHPPHPARHRADLMSSYAARASTTSSYAIPYVTTRGPYGDRTVDVYSRLLDERIVYLGTGIDDGVANAVIAQLLHLESESPELPINLYVNSVGGSIAGDPGRVRRHAVRRPAGGDDVRGAGRRRARRCCWPGERLDTGGCCPADGWWSSPPPPRDGAPSLT